MKQVWRRWRLRVGVTVILGAIQWTAGERIGRLLWAMIGG